MRLVRIVYIDVDSLRSDHMGCYGYPRNTTPNIDKIAQQGTVFARAYCEASPCVPSRATFISGRFAINHGALTHWGPGGRFWHPEGETYSEQYPFLPRVLRQAGHRTVTISSFADRHLAWWFHAGWSEIHSHTLKRGNENADEVNAHVLPWIREHGREADYFLHVQYWDPHGFYTYPDEYMEPFVGQELATAPSAESFERRQADTHPRSGPFFHWSLQSQIPVKMPRQILGLSDYKQLIDGYDGGISYMDMHVGQIVQAFEQLGIADEVCFIISADHGESFGEHGIYMEHGTASEEVNHIPLVVRLPRSAGGQPTQVEQLVYNADVVATLVDLVGLPHPAGWDGLSLLPLLRGAATWPRTHLVLEHGLYSCQRSVRQGDHLYTRTYDGGFYTLPSEALYDLAADPMQARDLSAAHPQLVQAFDQAIVRFVQDNRARHGHIPDPLDEILVTGPYRYLTPEQWAPRLIEGGRPDAAEQLLARRKSPY